MTCISAVSLHENVIGIHVVFSSCSIKQSSIKTLCTYSYYVCKMAKQCCYCFSIMYFYISQKLYKNSERQKTAGEIVIGETSPIFKKVTRWSLKTNAKAYTLPIRNSLTFFFSFLLSIYHQVKIELIKSTEEIWRCTCYHTEEMQMILGLRVIQFFQ